MCISIRCTLQRSISSQCLDFIGACGDDEESQVKLEFHSTLLLYHLNSLFELTSYHQAFPWRLVESVDPSRWSVMLQGMQKEWAFVLGVADRLSSKDLLWKLLAHTRWQSYREAMVTAEFLASSITGWRGACVDVWLLILSGW